MLRYFCPFHLPVTLNYFHSATEAIGVLFVYFKDASTIDMFKKSSPLTSRGKVLSRTSNQGRDSGSEKHLRDHEEKSKPELQFFGEVNACQKSQFGPRRDRD